MYTRPTGFSGVPPPGPAIPVTADSERRAGALANSVRERERHFGADRAFGFDQFRGHAHHAGFQFVAVADHAAEEIGRAAGNICEPLGDHPARAAFGGGDRGAIFGQDARDNFFQRFAVRGIKMFAESESHALGDFVEQLFGSCGIARPDARMQLNSGGRGENGGFGIGIQRVERAKRAVRLRIRGGR